MIGIARVAIAILLLAACTTADDVRRARVGGDDVAYATLGGAGPVVVFESGLGEDMREWAPVARALAPCTRVVMYDRPGIGRSAPRADPAPVRADAVAKRLAELLLAAGMPPPYVLVGHSLGGLYVQAFARDRPQDVAAVVLVDASSPLEPPGVFVPTVPAQPGTIAAAEDAGVAPSVAALLAGPPFPPVPLVVLAATDHGDTPEREALWRDVQARTAALSPNGRLEVVAGSGHFIQTDRPAAVVAAVLRVAREAGADVSRCVPDP